MAQLENFRLKVFRAVAEHLSLLMREQGSGSRRVVETSHPGCCRVLGKAKVCRAVDRPHAQSCDVKSAMKERSCASPRHFDPSWLPYLCSTLRT